MSVANGSAVAAPLSRGAAPGETATERRDYSQDRIYEMASSVFIAHLKRGEE